MIEPTIGEGLAMAWSERKVRERVPDVPGALARARRLLRALTAQERAAVARLVIHEHLALLRAWPPGPPATYMTDFKIGEFSAIEHCQKIAGRLGKTP